MIMIARVAILVLVGVPVVVGLLLVAGLLAWAGPNPLRSFIQRGTNAGAPVSPRSAISCGATLNAGMNLGFHIQTFSSGLRAAVWYPTTSAEARFLYPGSLASSVALDAPVATCSQYPLIVFSHGFAGCGIQSVLFTEELARAGYIVVGPDHKDSICKSDGPSQGSALRRAKQPFFRPGKWTDATYTDRAADIRLVLDEILRDPQFGPRIDASKIGAVGHSLGGYTIFGLAGGWPSWRDERIKVALLMSPYLIPYVRKGMVPSVHVPLMYQGGTGDFTLTPILKRSGGIYDSSNPPKYFVEFAGVHHLDFSNFTCGSSRSVSDCLANSSSARLMNTYGIGFLNRYLKGEPEPLLDRSNSEVIEYRYAR